MEEKIALTTMGTQQAKLVDQSEEYSRGEVTMVTDWKWSWDVFQHQGQQKDCAVKNADENT